jgi:uncharacterized membrane protein YraQ (UPF0718 family)
MSVLRDVLVASWEAFYVSSPYILLGLGMAGLLHVWIRPAQVARWLGRPGFASLAAGAGLGVPLPLCSCSVVPVTIELARKGASREASLAFMVSTPETGVDSILLTWGLMGPVMAVARPLAALATSLTAGLVSMAARRRGPLPAAPAPVAAAAAPPPAAGTTPPAEPVGRRGVLRAAGEYAFVRLLDEIGFWLLLGFLLTGLITALLPAGLLAAPGRGLGVMLALLALGVPLYMCASASTPVAAALMLKGASPGAALVFLLSGPATNASTLLLVARFFGKSFVKIYLGSIVAVSLASGILLDLLATRFAWRITPVLGDAETHGWPYGVAAAILGVLLAWRLASGALRTGAADFARNLRRLLGLPARLDDAASAPLGGGPR